MIHLIVGHRGTGKSKLLERINQYYSQLKLQVLTIDLDDEIANRTGLSIQELFLNKGEAEFRKVEEKTLLRLIEEHMGDHFPTYIALGAGYEGTIPDFVKVLWLGRPSDKSGRIFLDRPRLNPEVSPLEEYNLRYVSRQFRYAQIYDTKLTVSEGFDFCNNAEKSLLGLRPQNLSAQVTLLPEYLQKKSRLQSFFQNCQTLGIRQIELRDDLLTNDQIKELLKAFPQQNFLISFRKKEGPRLDHYDIFERDFDWAMELGECPYGEPPILSLHDLLPDESIDSALNRLCAKPARHFKFSPLVDNLMDLWTAHTWCLNNLSLNSFLPRSINGKWSWYRLAYGTKMRLNFLTDSQGSAPDQPSFFDAILRAEFNSAQNFAAIMGQPIDLSRTPSEQYEFFKKFNLPVFRIECEESEINEINLSILRRLGLVAAAVTSPLKTEMANRCARLTSEAYELKSVNTIVWDKRENEWLGACTDVIGLRDVLSGMSLPESVAVWGGGGLKSTLLKTLPEATFFRARTGFSMPKVSEGYAPDMLVWAVGASRQAHCIWPNKNWRPKLVFDLNYSENSPGREYAQKVGARYISGAQFFKSQAKAQQLFWSEYLQGQNKQKEQSV